MKFENPSNRSRQTEALKLFCKEFGLTFVENKDFAFLDATLRKNTKFIGQAEVKGVHSNYADKDYVVVSMRKMVDCQKEQIKNKKPVAIIWAFDDCIAYERLENLAGEFYFGGRKKRKGSTHDIELMVKIDKQKLIKIEVNK
tara:strand:- start:222 stop:647 length:426 start_codon:yes stop_codon:yes gene_type:complete